MDDEAATSFHSLLDCFFIVFPEVSPSLCSHLRREAGLQVAPLFLEISVSVIKKFSIYDIL